MSGPATVEGMPQPDDAWGARVDSLEAGDGVWTPPVPRDASTVCLLRDTDDGLEVFMLRRVSSMAFAAGMHVYPGGAVERSDAEVPTAQRVPDSVLDARTWSDRGRAVLVAAARETFEECGVLLAVDADGRTPGPEDVLDSERESLIAGAVEFGALLRERGLVVADDALVPFALWLTPEIEERRYDTRFFVAAQPGGQAARHVGGESERSAWWRPKDALSAYAQGRMAMWPPTLSVMRFLAEHPTSADAVAAAAARDVVPLMPESYRDASGGLGVRLVHARTHEVVADVRDDDYDGAPS
jgi:8-oxo-dGTP pyrophosphatase MutT (NUDIX family)